MKFPFFSVIAASMAEFVRYQKVFIFLVMWSDLLGEVRGVGGHMGQTTNPKDFFFPLLLLSFKPIKIPLKCVFFFFFFTYQYIKCT